jgi:hypothetical protein
MPKGVVEGRGCVPTQSATRCLNRGCITVTYGVTSNCDVGFSQPRQGSKIMRSRQRRSDPENRDVECGMWNVEWRNKGEMDIGCEYSFRAARWAATRPAAPDEFNAVMRAKKPERRRPIPVLLCHLSSNIGNISPQRVTR